MPLEGTSTNADALSGLLRSNVSLQVVVLDDIEFCAIAPDVQNASGIRGRKRILCRLAKHLELVTDLVDAFAWRASSLPIVHNAPYIRRPAMDVICRTVR